MIGHHKPNKKKKRPTSIPKKLVRAVFNRDLHTCQACGSMSQALQLHHKNKKSQGGKDTIENLITLCWQCHRWLHDGVIKDIWKNS